MPTIYCEVKSICQLAENIHAANKKVGWWDELYGGSVLASHFLAGKIALIHSEISEGFSGWSRSAGSLHEVLDDHLPEYPMFHVELGDTAIRALDLLGYFGAVGGFNLASTDEIEIPAEHHVSQLHSVNHRLCTLHLITSDLLEDIRKGQGREVQILLTLLHGLYNGFQDELPDLTPIIQAKLTYNAQRADHKRENRAKEGGKAF